MTTLTQKVSQTNTGMDVARPSQSDRLVCTRAHVTVEKVSLPPYLSRTFRSVIAAGEQGINTLELQKAGVTNPSQAVSELVKLGANIMRERRMVVDEYGVKKCVGHYIHRADLTEAAAAAFPQIKESLSQ
ncbi:MAG: hypothetical protein NXH81_14580 [Halieaceae bacterium]|uniref:hypothetical protein n=1 Tax=Haliea alexandrii TaxID=2448162 RepID=UPI000F0BB8AF|nr:hypothetical protein [Haliea alexandrii]MCR9186621.1 hypothetical protein [Halieaceae bacterium]